MQYGPSMMSQIKTLHVKHKESHPFPGWLPFDMLFDIINGPHSMQFQIVVSSNIELTVTRYLTQSAQ